MFLQADDEEDNVPFEGFSQDDNDIAEQVLENAAPGKEVILSENSEEDSDSDKVCSDYDSPGHLTMKAACV